MDSASYLVKYILVAANLVAAFGGVLLMIIGALVLHSIKEVTQDAPNLAASASRLFISLGVVIFLFAFIGFCGACKEHYCMTVSYAALLIVIILVQVAIIIAVFILIPKSDKFTTTQLDTLFQEAYNKNNEISKEAFSELQSYMHCCGTSNFTSYLEIPGYNKTTLPESCCSEANHGSDADFCTSERSNKKGCTPVLIEYLHEKGKTLAFLGVGITIAESIAALFACSFAKTIKNRAEY